MIKSAEFANFAQSWRHPALDDLQMVNARYSSHSFTKHDHDEYVIVLIEHGAEATTWNGRSLVAPAGSIIIMNPGDVHDGHAADDQPWIYRGFYPTVARMMSTGANGDVSETAPHFSIPVIQDIELFLELQAVHCLLNGEVDVLEAQSRFLLSLTTLLARHADNPPSPRHRGREPAAIRRALEFINAHPTDNISLDALARVAGLSPFWLIRTFERHVGLTPHAYMIGQRVKLAKTLLVRGVPLAQVALDAGFSDQSHFTRRFRRIVGTTPGKYLQSVAA